MSNEPEEFQAPDWVKNKKAVINLKNDDNRCFLYCLLRN